MKRFLIIAFIAICGMTAKGQTPCDNMLFPTIDSLRSYINVYIRNSAVTAFTNLRLNTAMVGVTQWLECIQSTGGGGGTDNANVGTGYRILNQLTQELKTLAAGHGITIDSALSNRLRITVDTASLSKTVLIEGPGMDLTYTPPAIAGGYDTITFSSSGGSGEADSLLDQILSNPNGGSLTTDRKINVGGSSSLFLNGNNSSNGYPVVIYDDTLQVLHTQSQAKIYNLFRRLDKDETGGDFVFGVNESRFDNSTTSLINSVWRFGVNMGPGGNLYVEGKPALGIAFEEGWDQDGDGLNPWQEMHLVSITAAGVERRMLSFTAPESGGIDAFFTSSNLYGKRPTGLSTWFTMAPSDFRYYGEDPYWELSDTTNTNHRITLKVNSDGSANMGVFSDLAITTLTPGSELIVDMDLAADNANFAGYVTVTGAGGGPSTGLRVTSNDATYSNVSLESNAGTAQILKHAAAGGGNVQFYNNGTGSNFYFGNDNGPIMTVGPTLNVVMHGTVKIEGGSPGAGKVLTSDADGDASWQTPSGGGSLTFDMSLAESGGSVTLDNDEASPGNSEYYGTNGSGVKGYYALPSGTISGLTTAYLPKATSASTIGDSRLADDGTNVTATTNNFSLANSGNNWLTAAVDANTGSYTFNGATGATKLGLNLDIRHTDDLVNLTLVNATATTDVFFSGMRNAYFSPTGIFSVATEIHSTGGAGSFVFDDQVTSGKFTSIERNTGSIRITGLRESSGATTTPWTLHADAPNNSWDMAGTGIITTANLQKYASDLSGSYDARTLVDKGYVDGLITTATSGTHTPTLTSVTNVNGTPTATQGQYIRVGNSVTFSVTVTLSATATGLVELGISLPVASDFSADYNAVGNAVATVVSSVAIAGQVLGDVTNNRLSLVYSAPDTEARTFTVHVTYKIVAP